MLLFVVLLFNVVVANIVFRLFFLFLLFFVAAVFVVVAAVAVKKYHIETTSIFCNKGLMKQYTIYHIISIMQRCISRYIDT